RKEIKNTIKSFQLPIYIWACKEHLKMEEVRAAIYFLRTCEIKEYLHKSTLEKKEENLNVCIKAISFMLDEIVNPDVSFVADEDVERKCVYCPYSSLCR
ncbi:MAG: PD-(D/E)XK nuclease family protein, partial [Candidatus Omnitrophica bacterium]|nr:PD-(D/E)XK nuclease family protein [Candidatus Omnitrophota bacterium]